MSENQFFSGLSNQETSDMTRAAFSLIPSTSYEEHKEEIQQAITQNNPTSLLKFADIETQEPNFLAFLDTIQGEPEKIAILSLKSDGNTLFETLSIKSQIELFDSFSSENKRNAPSSFNCPINRFSKPIQSKILNTLTIDELYETISQKNEEGLLSLSYFTQHVQKAILCVQPPQKRFDLINQINPKTGITYFGAFNYTDNKTEMLKDMTPDQKFILLMTPDYNGLPSYLSLFESAPHCCSTDDEEKFTVLEGLSADQRFTLLTSEFENGTRAYCELSSKQKVEVLDGFSADQIIDLLSSRNHRGNSAYDNFLLISDQQEALQKLSPQDQERLQNTLQNPQPCATNRPQIPPRAQYYR